MKSRLTIFLLPVVLFAIGSNVFASDPPVISNLSAQQRAGTYFVDVYFDIDDDESANITILMPTITIDGTPIQVTGIDSGDVGLISKGTDKHVRWNAGIDFRDNYSDNVILTIIAADGEGKTASGSTDPFIVDTRINKPPVDGWQTVTDSGSTYNENIVIDNNGRIWCFYLRSPGSGQPIYMKVINPDGFVYKSEQIIATASSLSANEYQSIRAALNKETGNVWMVYQSEDAGKNAGKFIIFNDTAGVEQNSTMLETPGAVHAPKLASDGTGVMWFSWHTAAFGDPASYACFTRYNPDGTILDTDSTRFETNGSVKNTDIAIDNEGKAWLVYEKDNSSVLTIYSSEGSYISSYEYSIDPSPFSTRKVIYSDWENGGQWVLKKNSDPTLNQIIRFDIDGSPSIPIGEVNSCSFLLNENDRIEAVRFNSLNNRYQYSEYNPLNKSTITGWTDLFGGASYNDAVNEFIAYNSNFPTLKTYLVKTDQSVTKLKLMDVEPLTITIDLSDDEFHFGKVGIDTLKKDTLTVLNTGNTTLNVSGISIDDPHFSVDQSSFSLEADQARDVIITFEPSDTSDYEATLMITSNAFNGTQNIPLTGVGYRRTWLISLQPLTIDFGAVPLEDIVSDSFRIKNTGTEHIFVHDLQISGDVFSLSDSMDTFFLAPKDSQFIGIKFNPVAESLYTGYAYVFSNADSSSGGANLTAGQLKLSTALLDTPQVFLKGSGYVYIAPRIGVEPAEVRFDTTRIGYSKTKSFEIFNYGNDTLIVTDIYSDDDQFAIDPDSAEFTIPPGDTQMVDIIFTPNTANYSRATISIESNDPANPVITLIADGDGFTYGDPDIYVNPPQLIFNTIRIGKNQERSFYIDNRGTDNLHITSITTNSSHFTVSYDTSSYGENLVLQPGEPVIYVNVTFRPLSAGNFNGQVLIHSNDPDSSQARIELIGFGRDPYLQEISVKPDSVLRFGETTIDQSNEKELIIKNDGELMLNVDSVKITNTNFVVVDSAQSFEIGESDSVGLLISFRPTAERNYYDTLSVFNNDPEDPEVKILLTGTGVPVPPQNIVVNPTSLDFGEISKSRYLTKYIRISNSGELQLNVSGITSNMDEFSVDNEEFSLQPTEKKYVAITFNPNGNTGTFNGVISIESDDPDESVKEISVTGTSRALNPPAISTNFDEEGIDFGMVALNSTATVYLQIFNNGEQNLVVTDISINDPKINMEPTSFSVYPGSYQWAKVSFTPTQIGAINKSLTIFSNASNSPEHVITVIGEGRPLYAPRLSVPTQNYSFGEIIVNEQALLNFPVTNSGEDTLDIQITSSDTSHFSINTQAFRLLAGESKNIIVLFSPDSTTSYTNRLKLITNDPQNATKYIFITGEGRDLYDPDIFVTPKDSVDFGLARTGRSTPRMVTIGNRGEKELIVHSFSTDDPQFIIEPEDTSFSLKAQQEKSIRLRLKPDNTGAISANALIKSNDPNTPEFELKLFGIGRDRAAVVALNPDTMRFNTVLIGDSLSKPLYLKNVGEKQLNVSAVARSDQNNFWVDRDNFELDPGDSGLVNVKFKPVETDEFVETLTIKSNDPFRSDAYVYLFANGRDSIPQQISVSEDIMEFGGIAVGNQLVDTLYIRNLGEKRLNITNMSLNSDAFWIKQNEVSISDSGLFKLPIMFLPFEIKSYEDTLVIENNDADVQIVLTGSGREMTPSALTIDADTLDFGTVTIDSSVLLNFYVRNSGDQRMEILAIEGGDDQFFIEPDTATIGARGAKRINVLLKPSVPGRITTFLTIQTDAVINGTQTVILEANILESPFAPQIAVSPAEIDFETVLKDSVYTKKIWISNIGNDTLIVSNITISESLFSVSDSSFIVAPNNIKQLFLQLRTDVDDSTTIITGEMKFYSNDVLDSVVVVPLSAMIQRYLAPKIVVTPDSLDFGESTLKTQKSLNLHLSNIGELRLDIHSVTTSDSQFYVENKEIALEPNMSTKLPVYFKPLKSDTVKAQLEIASNDTTIDSLIVIPLKGIGRNITPQRISLSIDHIDFGTTPMNRSKTQSFFIKNSGERSLEVSRIMITDTSFTREFKIETNWISDNLMIVPARDSQKVDITYNPSTPDTIGIDLMIQSNDPANKTRIIGLAARSINYMGPQISFITDSLDFGELLLGGRKQIAFGIQNMSRDSTLIISNISIADSLLSGNFKIEPENLEIAPVSSDSVLITFVPDSNRLYQTELIVQHNDVWSDSVVKITGWGMLDHQGENQLATIPGWNYDGHYPYTDALTNGPDHAWFLKDIYLNERPLSAQLFVAFNDEIDIFINGSFVIHETSDSLMKWNIESMDITSYLKLGRNRIAAHVFNETGQGGFDAVLTVQTENGNEVLIRHGDYYPDEFAVWWYYVNSGMAPDAPVFHNTTSWYNYDYGWSSPDSILFAWDFEPGFGNQLFDDSRFNNRIFGTSVTFTEGLFGKALQFKTLDNSNVKIETNLDGIPKTIQMWVYCENEINGDQILINNGYNGYYGNGLFIDSDRRVGVFYPGGKLLTDFYLKKAQWYFLAVQYFQDSVRVFIDNNLSQTLVYNPSVPASRGYTFIGGNPEFTEEFDSFSGKIDQLQILNSANYKPTFGKVLAIEIEENPRGRKGEVVNLQFNIEPKPFSILSGELKYKPLSSTEFQYVNITTIDSVDSLIEAAIPPEHVTISGLQCRLELETNYGTIHYPDESDTSAMLYIPVYTVNEISPVAVDTVYKMISIPYKLDDKSVTKIFEDDLQNYDPYKWRMFQWNQVDTSYIEFGGEKWENQHGLIRGRSVWIVSNEQHLFDADSGWSAQNMDGFRIELTPGWNQIANPFPFAVAWDSVFSSFEKPDLFYWNTDSSDYHINEEVDVLKPWEGYFVNNPYEVSFNLIVPPVVAENGNIYLNRPLAKMYQQKYEHVKMLISVSARCGKYIDRHNFLGATDGAFPEWDRFDVPEPPKIGKYIQIYIDNTDWHSHAGKYAVDFKNLNRNGYVWNLRAVCNLKGATNQFNLSFKELKSIPEDWQMYLFDLDQDIAINLQQQNNYQLRMNSKTKTLRRMKLVAGNEDFVLENSDRIPLKPLEFKLYHNYPNPFNPTTRISFDLPKRSQVELYIYNIMGQRVRKLADHMLRGGHHELIWDGRSDSGNFVTSGLYFVRLKSGTHVTTQKMMIVK